MSFKIDNVALAGAATTDGVLSFGESLVWASKTSDKRVTIHAGEAKSGAWYDFGKYCQLWVTVVEGGASGAGSASSSSKQATTLQRFDGLRSADFQRISDYFRGSLSAALTKKSLSSKGVSFGGVRLKDGCLELTDDVGDLIAPLPLGSIAAAALPGKGEVEVQLADEDTVEREDECLVEIRFYVPEGAEIAGAAALKKSKKSAGGAGGEEVDVDGEEDEEDDDPAHALHAALVEGAGIRGGAGDPLVELDESNGGFLVPRGRFGVELFPTFLRMVGSTYEFKVQYKSIARITYLPLPTPMAESWETTNKYALVISLDDPLRQGTQRHPHLVWQLGKSVEAVKLNIPEEDRKAGRYEGLGADGSTEVRGELPKVVGQLLKKISGKPVYKPETFESAGRQRCVRTTHKGGQGLLFPLDKSMVFIHKPTLLMRYSDVERMEVQRYDSGGGAGGSRTWDLLVTLRGAAREGSKDYVFQSIDRSEKEGLVSFLQERKVNVIVPKDSGKGRVDYAKIEAGPEMDLDDEDEDEDDEDFGSEDGGSSDDDDDDDEDEAGTGGGGGSDDEEDDSAFVRKRKAGKGGRKAAPKKAPKGKKKKPSKKRRGSDDDDDDE